MSHKEILVIIVGIFFHKSLNSSIGLFATKCNDVTAFQNFNFQEYNIVHKERKGSRNGAGGVAILIKKKFSFELISDYDYLDLELVCIKIKFLKEDVNIISYYNPPDPKKLLNFNIFKKLNDEKNFIICGDFNAKSIAFGSIKENKNREILDLILQLNNVIFLNNDDSTHKSFSSDDESILDYILCSSSIYNNFKHFKVLKEDSMSSDHYPLLVNFDFYKILNEEKNCFDPVINLNFKKADWKKYSNSLPKTVPLDIENNISELNKFVTKSIIDCSMKCIPQKKFNNKLKLPEYLIDIIKWKNSMKPKNIEDKKKKNRIKKLIKEEIVAIKNKSWMDFIKSLGNKITSSRPFWQRIKKLKSKNENESKSTYIPNLFYENKVFKTDYEKAELFGNILHNVFQESNDPNFDNQFKEKVSKTIKTINEKTYSFKEFTLEELDKELKRLNKRASPGPDKIYNLQLNHRSIEFRKILLKLFNLTVKNNFIPEEWKIATVTMIPKKNKNSSNPKDYRPISVTSCIGKLCERLILSRIIKFLNENNIIINQQSGFRKNRQTKDNLFHLIQKTLETLNRKKKVCAIFFDIASAFDKVWHDGLIFKMTELKFPEYLIIWCKNFLSGRIFKIKLNNAFSIAHNIFTGVPQGSVLSPTLFSIYINDIPIRNKTNVYYSLLFADDLCTYFIFDKFGNINDIINKYLRELETWLNKWRLKMAPQKCNYIIFSNGTKCYKDELKLKMYKELLSHNDEPTFLGITFDPHFTFMNQVNNLKKKCSNRLNIIKILSNKNWSLSKETLTTIYQSLIRSVIDYSSPIIGRISKDKLKTLERIQNAAIRSIYNLKYDESSENLLKVSSLLSIKFRMNELNERFFNTAIQSQNPLIDELMDEYSKINEARLKYYKTPLSQFF